MGLEITDAEWALMRDRVERLDKNINGNGKAPLEDRLRKYIDERDKHKENNAQQMVEDLRGEVDERHAENKAMLDKISKTQDRIIPLIYTGVGIFITLEAIGLFKAK